jgi:hypothetical protein
MRLFEIARLALVAAVEGREFRAVAQALGQRREALAGEPHELLMIDRARRREHHARRVIALVHVALQRLAAEAVHRVHRAENGAAKRLARIGRFEKMVEDEIVRRVERLPDLLNDDAAFALEFLGLEDRVLEDVGEQIDGEREVVAENARIIGRHLMRGMRIEMAADGLDLLGDGAGRTALRALEGHVLEKMRDAMLMGALVAGACVHPDADRGRFEMRHVIGHHGETVAEPCHIHDHRNLLKPVTPPRPARAPG